MAGPCLWRHGHVVFQADPLRTGQALSDRFCSTSTLARSASTIHRSAWFNAES
jgi:hypothetical protein